MHISKSWIVGFSWLLISAFFYHLHNRDWALPEEMSQVQATVISSSCEFTSRMTPRGGTNSYFLYKLTFSYSIGGKSYLSNRYSQNDGYGSSLESCQKEMIGLVAGSTIVAKYDARNPEYAIYSIGAPKSSFLGDISLYLGIIFLAVASYRQFFKDRRKNKTPNKSFKARRFWHAPKTRP